MKNVKDAFKDINLMWGRRKQLFSLLYLCNHVITFKSLTDICFLFSSQMIHHTHLQEEEQYVGYRAFLSFLKTIKTGVSE